MQGDLHAAEEEAPPRGHVRPAQRDDGTVEDRGDGIGHPREDDQDDVYGVLDERELGRPEARPEDEREGEDPPEEPGDGEARVHEGVPVVRLGEEPDDPDPEAEVREARQERDRLEEGEPVPRVRGPVDPVEDDPEEEPEADPDHGGEHDEERVPVQGPLRFPPEPPRELLHAPRCPFHRPSSSDARDEPSERDKGFVPRGQSRGRRTPSSRAYRVPAIPRASASWDAMTTAAPNDVRARSKAPRTAAVPFASRAAVGSSARRTRGPVARARGAAGPRRPPPPAGPRPPGGGVGGVGGRPPGGPPRPGPHPVSGGAAGAGPRSPRRSGRRSGCGS